MRTTMSVGRLDGSDRGDPRPRTASRDRDTRALSSRTSFWLSRFTLARAGARQHRRRYGAELRPFPQGRRRFFRGYPHPAWKPPTTTEGRLASASRCDDGDRLGVVLGVAALTASSRPPPSSPAPGMRHLGSSIGAGRPARAIPNDGHRRRERTLRSGALPRGKGILGRADRRGDSVAPATTLHDRPHARSVFPAEPPHDAHLPRRGRSCSAVSPTGTST